MARVTPGDLVGGHAPAPHRRQLLAGRRPPDGEEVADGPTGGDLAPADRAGDELLVAGQDRQCLQGGDVTDPRQWERVVDGAVARWGRLDVLVNNAGIGVVAPLDGLAPEDHQRVVDVNLNGVYYGMRAVAGPMRAHHSGAIVNVSSIDGLVGVLGMTSYSATKFAVTGMTRSAAIELGPAGIRVNSVHPGVINSPMVQEAPAEIHAKLDALMAMQPIARMGEPAEVAALVLFLASDEAGYITGAQFVIDGGHLAGPWRPPLS